MHSLHFKKVAFSALLIASDTAHRSVSRTADPTRIQTPSAFAPHAGLSAKLQNCPKCTFEPSLRYFASAWNARQSILPEVPSTFTMEHREQGPVMRSSTLVSVVSSRPSRNAARLRLCQVSSWWATPRPPDTSRFGRKFSAVMFRLPRVVSSEAWINCVQGQQMANNANKLVSCRMWK
jgi:hypothetical protein